MNLNLLKDADTLSFIKPKQFVYKNIMAYQKRNNRIKDLNQINYVKSLLETSAQKCQQAGMYTPEVYLGTAQQMADAYSNQNPQYPRISFDTKDQKLKGQATPVPELTATIGNCTSTSYFLVKDSLPEGTKASQAELTYLRPDIVSNRIATSLGITQAPPATATIPPIPPIDVPMPSPVRGINEVQTTPPVLPVAPAQTQPAISKAQMAQTQVTTQPIAQTVPVTPPTQVQVAPVPAQSQAPNFLQSFATLATQPASKLNQAPIQPNQAPLPNQTPYVTVEMEDTEKTTETEVSDRDLVTPPTSVTAKIETKIKTNSAPAPIHNPGKSQKLEKVNKGLQQVGNLHENIGQVLKDMSKGEINPIQLHGDTLKIIGAFINGIPAGIQSARLQRISQQMEVVENKRKEIDLTMNIVGDEYISSTPLAPSPTPNPASIPNSAPVSKSVQARDPEKVPTPDPKDEAVPIPTPVSKEAVNSTPPVNSPATDKVAQSLSKSEKSMTEAIDELLKSNASIDEKLAAIEETLDKMLEQLIKIEKNLEVIKMSLNPDSPVENPQALVDSMVTETEAKTEVEVVANNPLAEVATKTEIDTEIVAEIKTQTEADRDVEVPEVIIDSTPDEDLYLDSDNEYSNEELLEDIDQTMANILSNYEGDSDKINRYLKQDGLRLTLTEAKDAIFVEEINDAGTRSLVFRAEANGEDWDIRSEVNDAKKLKILESFIKAEEAVKSEPEIEPEQQPAPKAPAVEEPCLSM